MDEVYILKVNQVKPYVVAYVIDYLHKILDNSHSQAWTFRWAIMGKPIDWFCVTLTLLLQNLEQYPYLWKIIMNISNHVALILPEICFSLNEKQFSAIIPPKHMRALLCYRL